MLDKLSGDYNRGYTKAIQDIIEIVNYIEPDLAYHKKRLNYKMTKQLLQIILQEREKIRERINDCFIRWNGQKSEFELWWRGKE